MATNDAEKNSAILNHLRAIAAHEAGIADLAGNTDSHILVDPATDRAWKWWYSEGRYRPTDCRVHVVSGADEPAEESPPPEPEPEAEAENPLGSLRPMKPLDEKAIEHIASVLMKQLRAGAKSVSIARDGDGVTYSASCDTA